MSNLTFEKFEQTMPFAMTINLCDGAGNPTGRTKTVQFMNGDELCNWYERNSFKGGGKKKKKGGGKKKNFPKNKNRSPKKRTDEK